MIGVGGIGIGGDRGVRLVLASEVMEGGSVCNVSWFSLVVAIRWGRRYSGGLAVMEVLRAVAELQLSPIARVAC